MAEYTSTDTHGNCVFCGIVRRDISTPGIFWEDEQFMAFLSTWPSTEGFTVVIPKKHYRSDVLKLPDEILQSLVLAAKHASQLLLAQFPDVGRVGLIMEGTGIDHAHIKLVPMHNTPELRVGWKQYLSNRSDYFTEYPGYLISTDGPKADSEQLAALARELRSRA
jgi:diadenosine tetraphosphate (Ap4A) HIT family hydrolase